MTTLHPSSLLTQGHTLIVGHGAAYQTLVAGDLAFSKRRAEHAVLVVCSDYESQAREVHNDFARWRNARRDPNEHHADFDFSLIETRDLYTYGDFAGELHDHLRKIGARSHPVMLYRPIHHVGHFYREHDVWWEWAPKLIKAGIARWIVTIGTVAEHNWKPDPKLADPIFITSNGPWPHPDALPRSGEGTEVTIRRVRPAGEPIYARGRSWPHITFDYHPDYESANAAQVTA